MKTLVCDQPGQLTLQERPAPERQPDEVRLRVRSVGVCGTDLHIFAGRQPYLQYPRVMGHEFSAQVLEAPAGSPLRPGDAVFVMPYLSCGTCVACRTAARLKRTKSDASALSSTELRSPGRASAQTASASASKYSRAITLMHAPRPPPRG